MAGETNSSPRRYRVLASLGRLVLTLLICVVIGGLSVDGYTHFQHQRLRSQIQTIMNGPEVGTRTELLVSPWYTTHAFISSQYRVSGTYDAVTMQLAHRLTELGYTVTARQSVVVDAYNAHLKTLMVIFLASPSGQASGQLVKGDDMTTTLGISAYYGNADSVPASSNR